MKDTYICNILKITQFTKIILRPLYEVILILWKAILNFTKYNISNFGVIINIKTGLILKKYINRQGYAVVALYSDTVKNKPVRISRLVALTYLPNPERKKTVNHLNHNRKDDFVGNLE